MNANVDRNQAANALRAELVKTLRTLALLNDAANAVGEEVGAELAYAAEQINDVVERIDTGNVGRPNVRNAAGFLRNTSDTSTTLSNYVGYSGTLGRKVSIPNNS